MALAMRCFILVALKPNTVQIPSCNYYQPNSMIMLQTHHDRKHGWNISRSIITCAKKPPLSSGGGGQTNQTPEDQPKVPDSSSPNSQSDGQKSKGDANSTAPKKSGATN